MTNPSTDLKLTADQLDRLGKLADTCDNLSAATGLPMPPQFHVDTLKSSLTTLGSRIKALYVEVSGENPWE